MKVEVLYFDGCPNHQAPLRRLRELLASTVIAADIGLFAAVRTPTPLSERGSSRSPTLRNDSQDVEAGADQRSDFGLKCRLYTACHGWTRPRSG